MTRARDLGDFIADGGVSQLDVTGDVSIADKIIHTGDTNTAIRFPAADTVSFETSGSERFRVASSGQLGIGGANYGTTGQLLTSRGNGAAPTWSDAPSSGTSTGFVYFMRG